MAQPSSSFWLDLEPRPTRPPLQGVERAEVAVVGAGVAGAFLSLHLAEAGARVLCLEAEQAGFGASGRNAGFLLADGSETFAEVARTRGTEPAIALRTAGLLTRDAVARIAQDEDVGLAWRGSLRLAEDDDEACDLRDTATTLGAPVAFLEADALPPAYLGRGFRAGLVDPKDGEVHPLRLLRATWRRAESEGARLHERTPVLHAEEGRHAVRLYTPHGAVEAEQVVVATNAWIRRLLPDGPFVRPVRAQMLAARSSPSPDWDVPVYARRGGDYWRRLPDGTLLFGGMRRTALAAEETTDTAPSAEIQGRLEEALVAMLPEGARVEVLARWAGTMGFTPDGLPAAGPVPGRARTWVLGGWTGHGMGWGPGLAGVVAEALRGRGAGVPSSFSPSRSALVDPSWANLRGGDRG
jgi:glycine/D-amino acid oxidase-like deaminating enzyme